MNLKQIKAKIPRQIYLTSNQNRQPERSIRKLSSRNKLFSGSNISKTDKIILNEFSKGDYLIFTKANKGGATVILDVENYIKKANKELMRIIIRDHNPTQEHKKLLTTQLKYFSDNTFYRKIFVTI